MDWQPIETAPKDGTRILLHPPQFVADVAAVGYWSKFGCWADRQAVDPTWSPTHWMPMPASPQSKPTAARTPDASELGGPYPEHEP